METVEKRVERISERVVSYTKYIFHLLFFFLFLCHIGYYILAKSLSIYCKSNDAIMKREFKQYWLTIPQTTNNRLLSSLNEHKKTDLGLFRVAVSKS